MDDIYDRLDLMDYDDLPTCERCGKPLTSDLDGDGVMTAQAYYCEHCGDEDEDEEDEGPPRIFKNCVVCGRGMIDEDHELGTGMCMVCNYQ